MSKLTNGLIQVKAFNPEHYPVGTAVLITYTDTTAAYQTGLDSIDIKSEIGVIVSYTDSNTTMRLTTERTANSLSPWVCMAGISIHVEDVENERIVLTRLLPEAPEMEEMDYASALKEATEQ